MDVTKGMGRDCRRDLNRGVKNAPGCGPHLEQCQKHRNVTALHAVHSHGAGRWEMRGLWKGSGHPEVKPELPEGISHLSLGQRLPSSTTAVAAAWPTAVQDLAQASDASSPGFKDSRGGLGTGCSSQWLRLIRPGSVVADMSAQSVCRPGMAGSGRWMVVISRRPL